MLKFDKIFIKLLLAWLFLSAFYYAGNFISGDILADRSSNIYFKAFKYIVAIMLSLAFIFAFRSTKLLAIYLVIIFFAANGVALQLSGYQMSNYFDVLAVLGAFIGFALIGSKLSSTGIKKLSSILLYSGFIVSLISYFEFLFMEPILGEYWTNTGGFRSISTLLNPNNLGIYLGAIIIVSVLSPRASHERAIDPIMLLVIFGALLLSGSRTAILSFIFTCFIASIFGRKDGLTYSAIIRTGSYFALAFIIIIIIWAMDKIPDRAVDMNTAKIRIEKYFSFIINMDISYFYPDFNGTRTDIVSESAYFYFFNELGLVYGGLLILAVILISMTSSSNPPISSSNKPFRFVSLFYAVAMLFENVLMSFPNNQLFFITLGVAFSHPPLLTKKLLG